MDFFTVSTQSTKTGILVKPQFIVKKSQDLMVRGKSFYAVWDEEKGLWSTDEYDVARLVDQELQVYREDIGPMANVLWMTDFSTNSWKDFRSYVSNISDSAVALNNKVTFKNTPVRRKDYASIRLDYNLDAGATEAYDELMSTLYDPEERDKLEWAIGSIVAGDSQKIQKFIVLYGPSGYGKSTVMNVVQRLFEGYYAVFNAGEMVSRSNSFSTTPFKDNPLVGIDHDDDLSNVKDNSLLNSVVSHEEIIVNEKFKSVFTSRARAMLFIGTNKPVKITDAKSGLLRRLIDVHPSGRLVPEGRYHILVSQIDFELGAIAHRCLEKFRSMGPNYYSDYRPVRMMFETNSFYNFVEYNYDTFKHQDGTTLQQAYDIYKTFCAESNIKEPMPRHAFRIELGNYFKEFHERAVFQGGQSRSVFKGFEASKFLERGQKFTPVYSLVMEETESPLDDLLKDRPAQLARLLDDGQEIPSRKWAEVETKLSEIDTAQVHYVKPPDNMVVIDFDIRDETGDKSQEMNVAEASKWPPTYAEYSKSGAGIHLHYFYDGDPSELSTVYSEGIEVKTFRGDASLRRRLSKCNNVPVAAISGGLPLKEKKVIDFDKVRSEKGLRALIEKNLRKEVHPGTKPSIDFIKKILDDANADGLEFDVTDLRPRVLAFANNSTNQASYCVTQVAGMRFASDHEKEPVRPPGQYDDDRLVMFDCEVYPNLFLISWKFFGEPEVFRMYNPTSSDVAKLFKKKLCGYNNRKYDNHILYAKYLGYDNEKIFELSKKLIDNNPNAYFREAYELSFMDIYDVLTTKQTLKKWQIELGIFHKEVNFPWDKPLPQENWEEVGIYCDNDVISEEAVLRHRWQDYVAREILSKLSGLSINSTTRMHAQRILFGTERNPQREFVYTDLSEMFPGYKYSFGKSTYRGLEVGEGGFVYGEPGIYTNVAVLDIASMHPTSIEQLNLFGKYTQKFSEIKQARIAIKHRDYAAAGEMLGGALKPYLGDDDEAKGLSDALKIVVNSIYGFTAATFDNAFKDHRNIDNIVAKRGALFMIDLMKHVQALGIQVIHIKTDSIKIPDASPEIIQNIMDFGAQYGYTFEHEDTYQRMCLANEAVYIALSGDGKWSPTGTQFAVPFVFKTLFSKEPLDFEDYCVTRAVTTGLYLDFEGQKEPEADKLKFVGKTGRFVPVLPGHGGGTLLREKDGKFYAASASKGYSWLEADVAKERGALEFVDASYFTKMVDEAKESIAKFGDVEAFLP